MLSITKARIENLTDGVFAIVMTLLVIDLKITDDATNPTELYNSLVDNSAILQSYFLVFLTLTNYWFIHHTLISISAKNISRYLASLNILFLMFLSLLPFSANVMGRYSMDPMALWVYGGNVIGILGALTLMRYEIDRQHGEDTHPMSQGDRRIEAIRTWMTLICIVGGMVIAGVAPPGPVSNSIAIGLFLVPRVIGLIPASIGWIDRHIIGYFWKR